MDFLHPTNAEELANIAEETGAEVIRGPLRYPSETGSWQLGDVDLNEHLWQYRDHEVTLILAVTGEAEPERFGVRHLRIRDGRVGRLPSVQAPEQSDCRSYQAVAGQGSTRCSRRSRRFWGMRRSDARSD